MWPFRKKSEGDIQAVMQQSFSAVQQDNQRLYQWLQFLYQKTQQQDQLLGYLQQQINSLPSPQSLQVDPQEIRKVIDAHFSLQELQQRILDLQRHISDLKASHWKHREELAAMQSRLENLKSKAVSEAVSMATITSVGATQQEKVSEQPVSKRTRFQEKITKNISKHSKSYLKSMLHKLIDKYQRISALQLKQIMVDEQKLCSKSSFYRLLGEIEQESVVGVVKDGRQKFYLQSTKAKE